MRFAMRSVFINDLGIRIRKAAVENGTVAEQYPNLFTDSLGVIRLTELNQGPGAVIRKRQ